MTLAALLFAVNASVSKVLLEAGVEPARLTAVRCTGTALGLGLVLLVVAPGRLRVSARELPALVVLGLAGAAIVQWGRRQPRPGIADVLHVRFRSAVLGGCAAMVVVRLR
ncbi:MAG TPA: hypothetical protein VFH23_16720 [Jiangellaceae bacterium]|nr:hypothetical protein [Jiangellaceae bacterium]